MHLIGDKKRSHESIVGLLLCGVKTFLEICILCPC